MKKPTGFFVILAMSVGFFAGTFSKREKPKHEHLNISDYFGKPADYHLNVDATGYELLDNGRHVAKIPWDQDPVLDSVVLKDNE